MAAQGYTKDTPAEAPEDSEPESSDNEVDDEEMERQMAAMEALRKKGPRCSVAAEATTVDKDWQPPIHKKSDEQKETLRKAVGKSFIFSSIMSDPKLLGQIIDAFEGPHNKKAGDKVIEQGKMVTAGEPALFIVESGNLDVFKKTEEKGETKVFTYNEMGQAFGELALLYNCPRAATVVATGDCVLWSIDRDTFNNCVISGYKALREKNAEFLKSIEILSCLQPENIQRLVDVVKTRAFAKGESIIKKDAIGDEFFLLNEGAAAASIDGEVVKEYSKPGDYFGELALLENSKRKADVVATSDNTIVSVIDSDAFSQLLGNLHELMKKKAEEYK